VTTKTLASHSSESLGQIGSSVLTAAVSMTPVAVSNCDERLRGLMREVVSTLAFAGTKQGTFVLAGTIALAKRITASMLMLDEAEVGNDEIADGFGEMLNMLGGNYKNEWIKGQERRLDLTVPSTMFGMVGLTSMRNADELHAVEFELDGGKLLFGIIVWG
jgi:CheY-specific phosphatase CheX